MKKYLIVLLALTVFTGCSGETGPDNSVEIPEHLHGIENLTVYPADTQPRLAIDLVPVQSFGENDELLIGTIGGAVVDDRNRVLLWEGSMQSMKLHVFNPDGTYHSQIGRTGQGPGEYQYIGSLQLKNNKIFLRDLLSSRVNVYSDEDFSHIESFMPQQWDVMNHEIVEGMRFSEFYVLNNGNAVVKFTGSPTPENEPIPQKLVYVDSNGSMIGENIIESSIANMLMHSEGGGIIMMPLNFQGAIFQVLSSDDELYVVSDKDFLIEKYDVEGNYLASFYYPISKSLFNPDAFFEGRTNSFNFDFRGAVESNMGLPETWPSLNALKIDDENRIWAAVIVDDQEVYEWWILEVSGEPVTRFTWPRNKAIQVIKNGHVYTRETDEATGLQTIEKYLIQLSE